MINYKRLAALLMFVFGIIIVAENFYLMIQVSGRKLQMYYGLLTLAALFLSLGALYVWRKEKG